MKKIFLDKPSDNLFRILKKYESSTKLKIKEYVECLKNLSNHKKLLRIDMNGREKKISKYFFDKNKYIYVKNKDDIKSFENKEKRENTNIFVIKKSLKKERKLHKSLKVFKDTYDLSQEEIIYMKFIYKIKIKNIFSLINNLRKNIYIDKQKEKILLNCIYKYLSYNCYVLSKNEFFFFIYIFPQQIKYSNKVMYYITSLLDNDNININEFITLITEINLLYINYHIRDKYIDYLNRNINNINILHIFDILTKGSYVFTILLNYSYEKKYFIFIENLLNVIKEKKIVFNEEIKYKYLNFISDYVNNNIYSNTFFSDVYTSLYKKIFLENYDYIKDIDYIKSVIKLTNHDIILRNINNILLKKNRQTILCNDKNIKIKVFPSYLEEAKENKVHGIDINSNYNDNFNSNNVKNEKDNINALCNSINKIKNLNIKENFFEEKKNNSNYLSEVSSENKNKINYANVEMHTKKNCVNINNDNSHFKKIEYKKSKNMCISNNKENIFNNNNNENLIYEEKLIQNRESMNCKFQTKKNIFCFTYPWDKIKNMKYEELKEKYKISTKITDKNIKILLKFLKISFHSKNSYLDEIFDKKNIFQIMSSIKNRNLKYDKNNENFVKLFYQFVDKWNHISIKKTINENCIRSFEKKETEEKKITDKLENKSSPSCIIANTKTDVKKENIKIDINKKKKSSYTNFNYYLVSSNIKKEPNLYEKKDALLHECFNNSLEYQIKNNFFSFNLEKKNNNNILNLVNNIYFNLDYNNKIYYKSQINSTSKFLYYLCYSFNSYFENIKNNDTRYKIINLDCFIKTFYEIFTFVLKNINLINISNYFYIFVSLSKFVNAPLVTGGDEKKNNKNDYNSRISVLLYIIHLIKKYEYNNIKNILDDKNNQNYFLYSEYDKNNMSKYKKLSYDILHESILNNFKLDNIYISNVIKNERLLKKDSAHDLENKNDVKYINNTNAKNDNNNNNIIIMNNNLNSLFYNYIFINSYNFIIMFLNNYFDFTNFKLKKFLISIFYLYKMIPSNIKFIYHLESKLYNNHINFVNRYFYIFNGVNENKRLLNKEYVALIKEYYLKECSYNNLIYSENLIYNYKYNIYDNIENIFQKKKHFFLLEDTLNFTFIYSLNKFYYSTIYYDISKHLYKFDIIFLNEKIKTLLFFLFFQCKSVYKPLSFLLLSEIMKYDCIKNSGRINLYILCNLILILIKDSKIKIKNTIYIKRKYSKFHCNYFFPLEIFVLKNLLIFVEKKIKNLEKNIESREDRTKSIKEKMNVYNPFIFNLKYFKDDFKMNIPLLIKLYKQYCQIKSVKEKNNINSGFSSFFYFDDAIESEIFKNSLNFLSYDYVTENFHIPKKSLYYDILCHFKKNNINIL
ncbi:conserved Plasmodium protein, unknown function [Plasmodium relictum]|uniref:Uncharacterized protein n=1 Tax=Plasmodium relictum TaxID=85471 RepID=A0A1J1H1N8_PLARL|nr:conserved Plasmodium protein, unknown function [Plasmodium relictum]CRG98678.1 conserved Plasmodium protein, unknown function [Plasmodium relictum]